MENKTIRTDRSSDSTIDNDDTKRKKGSSRSARRLEDIDLRLSKATHRISKAVEKGIRTYRENRDESAAKRRDGALTDFVQNAAEGISDAIADSSRAITDVAKIVDRKRVRKNIRRMARRMPMVF